MNKALGLKLDLREAEKLALVIVRHHGLNVRMVRTLSIFIVIEARDLRTAQIRKVIGKKRQSVTMLRRRWGERIDDNPDLDANVWRATEVLRGDRPMMELAA